MNSERLFERELTRLNIHLPEKRISLKEALSSSKPLVKTKAGTTHSFKREELEFLSKITPKEEWDELRLPILIALEPKLGRGAARISGKAEGEVASKILNKRSGGELVIYRPEVAILRKKLPTTSQYLFMV